MNNYIWSDGSGRIEFPITQPQIDSVCRSGSNDDAVAAAAKPDLDPDLVRMALAEYGSWDKTELQDHNANLERIFWIACWDCFDEPELYAVA